MRTVCGSKFQTDGAENQKARLEKFVLVNGNIKFICHPAAGPTIRLGCSHVPSFGRTGKLECTCFALNFVHKKWQLVYAPLLDWIPMQLVEGNHLNHGVHCK